MRLFSAESIMTGKLIKRGLIVRQDYTVPMLMRGRVESAMSLTFAVVDADKNVQAVVREVSPEANGVLPVIQADGRLVGIVEAHDLLKGIDRNPTVREIMRQDYIAGLPNETVDQVTRDMVVHNVENIVVVDDEGKPIGVARAADILRLRRWMIEEEGIGNPPVRVKGSLPHIATTSSPGPA